MHHRDLPTGTSSGDGTWGNILNVSDGNYSTASTVSLSVAKTKQNRHI